MKKATRFLFRVVLILTIVLAAWYCHQTGALQKILKWVEDSGIWGPLLFLSLYVMSCVLFVPALIFTFSGGVMFGLVKGFGLSLLGISIGSAGALLMGRYLARGLVEKSLGQNGDWNKLARAMPQKGWKIVFLARLSLVFPFWIGNYAFGLTPIPVFHYLGASLLGSIPSVIVYTYIGTVTGSLALLNVANRSKTGGEWLLLAGGLIATVFLSYYLHRFAQKILKEDSRPDLRRGPLPEPESVKLAVLADGEEEAVPVGVCDP